MNLLPKERYFALILTSFAAGFSAAFSLFLAAIGAYHKADLCVLISCIFISLVAMIFLMARKQDVDLEGAIVRHLHRGN